MSIVSKIKASVEASTGLSLFYQDNETINEIIASNPLPCAFFALLRDTELLLDGNQNRERASVAVFFVDKTDFNFDSEENEEIIEACKTKANTWIRSVMQDGSLSISGSLRFARVYNEFDEILTGIAVNVTLEETYGFNACVDMEVEPSRVLKITENGQFDIHDYYWVDVDVQGGGGNLTTLNVTPTTQAQQITPVSPIDGYDEVNVSAVTSAIDSNIIAGNIKKDVDILGVTGTYEGDKSGDEFVFTYNNVDYMLQSDGCIMQGVDNVNFSWAKGVFLKECTIIARTNVVANNIRFVAPKVYSVGRNNNISGLQYLEVGTLTYIHGSAWSTNADNLSMFKVGADTDINILFSQWTANNIISTEAEQLQLIDNARSGILERVKEHEASSESRTCTIGWITTLSSSTYTSVQDALLELQLDADDIGWLFV